MTDDSDEKIAAPRRQKDFSALDPLQIPVFVADQTRRIIYANNAFAKLVGRVGEQLKGAQIDSLIRSGKSGIDCALAGDTSGIRTWATVGGKKYFFVYHPTLIHDPTGNITGVLETIEDLTEQQLALQTVEALVGKVKAGNLSARAKADAGGDYRLLLDGINEMLDTLIAPLNVVSDYIDRISRGDLPGQITGPRNGDFNSIRDSLNRCIKMIGGIAGEVDNLKRMILGEPAEERQNTGMYQGTFKDMIRDVNELIEAVVIPLNELMAELGRKVFH